MGDVHTKVQDIVGDFEIDDLQLFLKNNIRTVLIVAASIGTYLLLKKPSGLPPGPKWTLPLLGDLLSIMDKSDNGDPRLPLRRLRKKYGDIYSVYFGPRLFIVMNGYPLLKDALVKHGDVFSERPYFLLFEKISQNGGIAVSSGKTWKEQRKFALEALREFGFGRNIMEDKIREEIEVLVGVIAQKNGDAFDMSRLIQAAVSNVICSLVFGERFDYDNKLLLQFLDLAEENLKTLGSTQAVNFMPILRFLPGDPFYYHRTLRNTDKVNKLLIDPAIKEHIIHYNESNTNDFISCYLKEMKKNEGKDSSIDLLNLQTTVGDLFVAGSETTSTTILWSVLYFLHYPKVYQRCYKEIQDVIGSGRLPSVKDKVNMPYFEAFILELLRHVNIVLLGVPHGAVRDTVYKGYFIPKDAVVITNIDSVLASDEIWGDADTFRPERFLDDKGQVIHREEWIPFSLGRRVCLGENMAKLEIFLFLTTLVQRFDFQPEDPQNIPPLKGEFGITHAPHKYRFKAVPR